MKLTESWNKAASVRYRHLLTGKPLMTRAAEFLKDLACLRAAGSSRARSHSVASVTNQINRDSRRIVLVREFDSIPLLKNKPHLLLRWDLEPACRFPPPSRTGSISAASTNSPKGILSSCWHPRPLHPTASQRCKGCNKDTSSSCSVWRYRRRKKRDSLPSSNHIAVKNRMSFDSAS